MLSSRKSKVPSRIFIHREYFQRIFGKIYKRGTSDSSDKEISKRILRPLLTTILLNTSIIRSRNTTTHRVLFLRLLDSPSTVKFFKSASLRHCRLLSSSNPSPSFVPPWSVSHDVYIYISREGGFGWWGMTSPRGGKAREGEAEGVGVAPG